MNDAVVDLEQRYRSLLDGGNLSDALQALDALLAAAPAQANAWAHRGALLLQLGRPEAAATALAEAARLAPRDPEVRIARATALLQSGGADEAVEELDKAIRLGAVGSATWATRGSALAAAGRLPEANHSFAHAATLPGARSEVLNDWGVALYAAGDASAAYEKFSSALAARADNAEAAFNAGNALLRLGRVDEAIYILEQVVATRADKPAARLYLGSALERANRHDDARTHFAALAADGQLPERIRARASAGALSCDAECTRWQGRDDAIDSLKQFVTDGVSFSPLVLHAALDDPGVHRQAAANYWAFETASIAQRPATRLSARKSNRLRVGYMSSDFREHPVGFLLDSVFSAHDRDRVEVVGLSLRAADDSVVGARLRTHCDHFVDLGSLSDDAAAAEIERLQIDVLVDVNGYTRGHRVGILARRPAAVVAGYLGFPGTSGSSSLDYLVADRWIVPPQERAHYSESLAFLPSATLPRDGSWMDAAPRPSRDSEGLQDNQVVLLAMSPRKFTPEVFAVWCRALHGTPDAVLWVHGASSIAADNLRIEAASRGVDPTRLVFAQRVDDRGAHLGRLALADLMVDTFPYNAHATAVDSMIAGVPLVTVSGRGLASRVGGALVRQAGAPELATSTLSEYEALLMRLAAEREILRSHAARMRASGFGGRRDVEEYVRALELAWLRMHESAIVGTRGDFDAVA